MSEGLTKSGSRQELAAHTATVDPPLSFLAVLEDTQSAFSRRFVALTEAKLAACFSASICEIDLHIVLIDGIAFRKYCVLVALATDSDGRKHPLGLRKGRRRTQASLADLIERGLPSDRALLFVIDGAKALAQVWSSVDAKLARCQLERLATSLGTEHPGAAALIREGLDETLTLQEIGVTRCSTKCCIARIRSKT